MQVRLVRRHAPTPMTETTAKSSDDLKRLRAELDQANSALIDTQQELERVRSQRSETMARLERQTYWLQYAEIDLDALMKRKPFRWMFEAVRMLLKLRRRIAGRS